MQLKPGSNVKLADNSKITFRNGAYLNANGCTFSMFQGSHWQGIYFENPGSSAVTNCTFNSAQYSLYFYNNYSSSVLQTIRRNTFNESFNGCRGIYAKNIFNFTCDSNTFNMISSFSTLGLFVQNFLTAAPPAPGDNAYNLNVTNNVFNNGYVQCLLAGYVSSVTPFYVYHNTFTNNSNGWCLVTRLITDNVKENTFTNNSSWNTLGLWQSNVNMLNNTISNNNGNSMLLSVSSPNMAPLQINDQLILVGGNNTLFSQNKDNMSLNSTTYPITDFGQNNFTIGNTNNYHIYGRVPDSLDYYRARNNCWYGHGNQCSIVMFSDSTIASVDCSHTLGFNCSPPPQQGSVYEIINKGNGIYDTIYAVEDNTGSPPPQDEVIYIQSYEFKNNNNYLDAIIHYKYLIDNYTASQYLNNALDEMYICYEQLDTADQNHRNILFGDLKFYLENKIQSGNYDQSFMDHAYNIILMCEVKLTEYESAQSGYELIALYHPDPDVRLLASWDYGELQDWINEGGSEKPIEKLTGVELVNKLIKKLINILTVTLWLKRCMKIIKI